MFYHNTLLQKIYRFWIIAKTVKIYIENSSIIIDCYIIYLLGYYMYNNDDDDFNYALFLLALQLIYDYNSINLFKLPH